MDLVAERGFAAISLREVARGAGIVPTAFYRHFASMEDLGVTLVEDSMRVLRQALRESRRDLATRSALPTVRDSLARLVHHVHENEPEFLFILREQHGGVAEVRRAIGTELTLFARELALDLSRLPELASWPPEDMETVADLIVSEMRALVARILEAGPRGRGGGERQMVEEAERRLIIVLLGVGRWHVGSDEGADGVWDPRAAEGSTSGPRESDDRT